MWARRALGALCSLTLLLGLVAAVAMGRVDDPAAGRATTDRPARTDLRPVFATPPPRYDHVVVVIFENTNYSTIKSGAPYFMSLADQGAEMTQSFGVTHPSQPNYLALFSGSTQGVTGDTCPQDFTGKGNLGQQLVSAGFTFKAYSESLPSAGYTGCSGSSGDYVRKHAPWVDFDNLSQTLHRPFSEFPSDYSTLPTVSFVVPNMCNDMHDCSTSTGNTWLKNNLDAYAQWAKTHNSLLITTFDEDNFTSVNQIYTSLVGAGVTAGDYSQNINHYNVLRTLEDMYGLSALGNAANKSAITGIWGGGSSPVTVTNPGNQSSTTASSVNLQLGASGGTSPYTWSATGLPAGLTLSASTGQITGTPTTAGTYNVTVTATDSASTPASGSTSFTWTVTTSGGTCASGQKLKNPGFESGNDGSWSQTAGVIGQYGSSYPTHAGTWQAWLDGYGNSHTDTLSQTVALPSGCTSYTFDFYLRITTSETESVAYDTLTLTAGTTQLGKWTNLNATGWVKKSINLSQYAGTSVTLKFTGVEDSSLQTSFFVDDATVDVG
jgi:hypothetical protein